MANLFSPQTISASRLAKSHLPVPGIKTPAGTWETRGHPSRLVYITETELRLFAELFEEAESPALEARLPAVHSAELLKVLSRFSEARNQPDGSLPPFCATTMFDETYGQRDGKITRQTEPSFQPESENKWVIAGPHFFVGNPLAKTTKTKFSGRGGYLGIDLTEIPADFFPQSPYRPGDANGDLSAFNDSIRRWPGNSSEDRITTRFRHVNRQMCYSANERTLIAAIVPPGCTAIISAVVVTFSDDKELVSFSGSCFSVLFDFIIKVTGRGHVLGSDLEILPRLSGVCRTPIIRRALRLSALNQSYRNLWTSLADSKFRLESWTVDDAKLVNEFENPWANLNPQEWDWHTPVRTDFSRRQALVEIDVLVALALDMSLAELTTIYNVQFPVMRGYELTDEYDTKGRRLPNTTRKDAGAKEFREAREREGDEKSLTVSWQIDDGRETVTKTFYPPFTHVDREADYAVAYEVFKKRLNL